jgi:Sec1 family
MSVMIALQQTPKILYFDPSGKGTTHAARMAWHLKEASSVLDEYRCEWHNPHPEATVVVLDRFIDMFAPLIHCLTYEAAIHDLLDVNDRRVT